MFCLTLKLFNYFKKEDHGAQQLVVAVVAADAVAAARRDAAGGGPAHHGGCAAPAGWHPAGVPGVRGVRSDDAGAGGLGVAARQRGAWCSVPCAGLRRGVQRGLQRGLHRAGAPFGAFGLEAPTYIY